ncbi:MAG: hypothetical protein AMK69_28285 [Nitrospira bacterium SG8_3]|nr:MAG: hypothetical protein AMK69_28285 [Nitrospira bacterium SG8_3]
MAEERTVRHLRKVAVVGLASAHHETWFHQWAQASVSNEEMSTLSSEQGRTRVYAEELFRTSQAKTRGECRSGGKWSFMDGNWPMGYVGQGGLIQVRVICQGFDA